MYVVYVCVIGGPLDDKRHKRRSRRPVESAATARGGRRRERNKVRLTTPAASPFSGQMPARPWRYIVGPSPTPLRCCVYVWQVHVEQVVYSMFCCFDVLLPAS